MEKCKYCGAELEEEVTLCPECGKSNEEEMPAQQNALAEAEETAVQQNSLAEGEETSEEEGFDIVMDLDEPTEEEPTVKKATPRKIALSVIAVVVLLAIIAGLLITGLKPAADAAVQGTIPADGNPEDVTCKGSYSVTDRKVKWTGIEDTVVATMGEYTLTNAQLQVYYWNYVYSYLNSEAGYTQLMYGMIDYGQPFETQICSVDPTVTWQQYFLRCALENWQFMQALAIEGKENGFVVSAEDQAALAQTPADMEAAAKQSGYANAEELLAAKFGVGVSMDDYMHFENLYYQSIPYYYDLSAGMTVTEEEMEAFFNEHEAEYAELGLLRTDTLVDVRHILIMPEGATSETIRTESFPEEAWAASEVKAQGILQEYLDGELTEERFAELANTYTDDGNDSNMDGQPDGGLYTGITKDTGMVEEFLAWCMDPNRAVGDTEIVKTIFGYHIMYFVQSELLWPQYAEQDALSMKGNELIMGAVERHPVEVDYSAISIANVVLN